MSAMKIAFALSLALLAPLWSINTASACSCAVAAAPAARDASVVTFEGVLLRIEPPADDASPARAVFRLSRVWKGAPPRELTVEVQAQPTMCPPHFEVGQRYIVYASGTIQRPRVAQCARYAIASQLARERRELGNPIRTFPATDPR
jgi:hypothetical protein